ncbi:MAG: hypothetical protein QOH34_1049 [Mycobacterium sp.]|nr:hypothetical protein [Mycobacterium sp.]
MSGISRRNSARLEYVHSASKLSEIVAAVMPNYDALQHTPRNADHVTSNGGDGAPRTRWRQDLSRLRRQPPAFRGRFQSVIKGRMKSST